MPAFALCRWTTSGRVSLTIRVAAGGSRAATLGPGLRVASHRTTCAPEARAASASQPDAGQATVTVQPRATWSRT